MVQPILIRGEWKPSRGTETFQALNPAQRQPLPETYPISSWDEVQEALRAAAEAFQVVRNWPGERFARFLESYASEIESCSEELVARAHQETALPVSPRLKDGELPRTTQQLRLAAAAARDGSWRMPVIDSKANIRSQLAPIGPVAIFGPNNFPFAFNSISGGDFAAAVAAGNPVLAKGHPSHPGTTQILAQAAQAAADSAKMPPGFVQLIYHTSPEHGIRLVSAPEIAAVGYTGGRNAGLALKSAADQVGKPFFAELSSINPLYLLPGGLRESLDELVNEFVTSSLMGAGQFCTNPGLVILPAGEMAEKFLTSVAERFSTAPAGTLLGIGTETDLRASIVALQQAGARIVVGNKPVDQSRCCYANTVLQVTAAEFLQDSHSLQREAFGNCCLLVTNADIEEMVRIADSLEGSLTGTIYSSASGEDDEWYARIEPALRQKVGRLLNDKMPTGVAVSPAMNHGGPFPAASFPGFTSVGLPAAIHRFAMLQCYDNVRQSRLPVGLKDKNPTGSLWRSIDGNWTQGDVPAH